MPSGFAGACGLCLAKLTCVGVLVRLRARVRVCRACFAGPGAPDCAFYVKTGTCKYGATCKFNHPPAAQPELHPQRPGAPDCSFYMKTGECKFGPTCKFNHPPGIQPSAGAPGLGPGLGPGMGRNGPATSALEVAAQAAQLAREMGVNESTSADSANFS